MSLDNLRLSRPPKPPFYDRELEPPTRTITIPAAVAKRIAAALDPNDPIYPDAVAMLTGTTPQVYAAAPAVTDQAHGMPRPLAALR